MKRAFRSFSIVTIGLFACIILLTGCIRVIPKDGTTEPTVTPTPTPDIILVITLERTACFGACPVYSLKISGNGTVIYEGKKYVRVLGVQETAISANAINQLVSEFDKAGYFSLNDSYTKFNVTDMPSVNTSITIGSKTKSVKHYQGDRSAPQQLTELENKIDEIVNSAQWIK